MKREDVPNLEPMWGDNKGEARDKIFSFLNKQNLRIVTQVEPRSCSKMLETVKDPAPALVQEINDTNPKIKELRKKYTKDSIMRRNGLMLEHILLDRMCYDPIAINYYKTPENIQQL